MTGAGRLARALGTATLALLAACAPPDRDGAPEARVVLELLPQPARVGPATFTLAVDDGAGAPLPLEDLRVTGDMHHAGMAPSPATLVAAAPGRWTGALELTMGGDWFVLVEGRLPDGRRLERSLPLPGVQPR